MIAFMPEPQTLLIVVQPVVFGRPAASDAWRAGAWPRLAGSTQPMMTSETSAAGNAGLFERGLDRGGAESGGGNAGELAEE